MRIPNVLSVLACAALGALALPVSPALAGPQSQPPVVPVGTSRPAMSIAGINAADQSASIEWNGEHIVYLTRPGAGYSPRIVRISASMLRPC